MFKKIGVRNHISVHKLHYSCQIFKEDYFVDASSCMIVYKSSNPTYAFLMNLLSLCLHKAHMLPFDDFDPCMLMVLSLLSLPADALTAVIYVALTENVISNNNLLQELIKNKHRFGECFEVLLLLRNVFDIVRKKNLKVFLDC